MSGALPEDVEASGFTVGTLYVGPVTPRVPTAVRMLREAFAPLVHAINRAWPLRRQTPLGCQDVVLSARVYAPEPTWTGIRAALHANGVHNVVMFRPRGRTGVRHEVTIEIDLDSFEAGGC